MLFDMRPDFSYPILERPASSVPNSNSKDASLILNSLVSSLAWLAGTQTT